MSKTELINGVNDLMNFIKESHLITKHHSHLRIWFRGHSDKSWKLHPGVYRKSFNCKNEVDRLNKEQHLSQDFRVFSASLRTRVEDNSELYFLQQHYGMPTRLLDWTNQPLAALFFAVISNSNTDGELFMLDAYGFAKQEMKDKEGEKHYGIATARNPLFKEAIYPIFNWKKIKDFPKFILPVRPDYFDKRMALQKSCFTFHSPENEILTPSHNETLTRIIIPKEAKKNIQMELRLLGIDHFNIFGDLDGLANTLKINYNA